MDNKLICEKLTELNTTDLIYMGNQFISEADIGEGEITPFEDLDEIMGVNGLQKALDDMGITTMLPFEYYAWDIYFHNRFLKDEDEAREYMLGTIERELCEDNISYFKEALEDYKNDDNKEVMECILSMI